jgi:uncharacterized membrane protein YozB (DUF420 family)
MLTSRKTALINATSLDAFFLSTALFNFFSVAIVLALGYAPELTDYSGSYITIVPTREAVFLTASVALVLISFYIRRTASAAGLRMALAISTISLTLLFINVALYSGVRAGLFERLGA